MASADPGAGGAKDPFISAFSGPIEPVRTTVGYRLSLVVVAAVMVLLPVAYVALVAAVGWGWVTYATEGTAIFQGGSGGMKGRLLAYIAPLVIGGILLLFMVKPLFAPRGQHAEPMPLDLRKERRLVGFINHLCDSVGAPRPTRIAISSEVNAYARLRRFFGSDLELCIGLPLASTMTVSELAAVIAHEFGHFSQAVGMRASQLIWRVNRWFARVVYQRDSWDEWLEQTAAEADHWGIAIVLHLSRFCVWLTRRVLWVLMMIGHLVSQILSRQMEFDADRYAVRLAGLAAFKEGMQRLPVTAAAEAMSHHALQQSFQQGVLADDLPGLIAAGVERIDPELRTKLIRDGMTSNTGMYDSHPSTRDRFDSADRDGSAGVLHRLDNPATALFADFPGAARAVTESFYRDELELPMQRLQLVPSRSFFEEEPATDHDESAPQDDADPQAEDDRIPVPW